MPNGRGPCNAAFVAFGSLSVTGGRFAVYGWLFDAKNPDSPQILGKQYNEAAARTMHAWSPIALLMRSLPAWVAGFPALPRPIFSTLHPEVGNKEIWQMDYDGQGAHQVTHLGTISLSPRVSPNNDRIAFASLGRQGGLFACIRWCWAARSAFHPW